MHNTFFVIGWTIAGFVFPEYFRMAFSKPGKEIGKVPFGLNLFTALAFACIAFYFTKG